MDFIRKNLVIFIPLVILEIILAVFAIRDILKADKFKIGSKYIWIPIALFIQIIGPIAYFAIGKENR